MHKFKNKKITVLGAARSGMSVVELLQKKGARVFISDNTNADKKQPEIERLNRLGIYYEFGIHSENALNADFIVLSPGIPFNSSIVRKAVEQKIPVYSEIEVSAWFCKSPIIAITGSNGKTTTTMLTGDMLLKEQPERIIAGNIGKPFADLVLNSKKNNWAVIEISSFQLETINKFHPKIAVILNFAPNHLDRYNSYEDYISAKLRIFKNLTEDDFLVYNADDKLLTEKIMEFPGQRLSYSASNPKTNAYLDGKELIVENNIILSTDEIKLNGQHNYMNIMAATLAARKANISFDSIRTALKNFAGVEHRLEFVREINGIRFVNDSKATTVESLAVALQSFDFPIILIAGGKDKGSDFSKLNNLVRSHVREIILIGISSNKIAKIWKDIKPVHLAESMEEAVRLAFKQAKEKDSVLLSPACTSFDMFSDYEDRGRLFKKMVKKIPV